MAHALLPAAHSKPTPFPRKHTALGSLDALETELIHLQRATAQPKPHRYELVPQ
ncbi:MAG: hypothetical protein HY238_13340 [Acidobacteria bacterium]|nr:hypothetical protein [Acidobacteriota bacterium]